MKAGIASPNGVVIADVPQPTPKPTDILVKVKAIALNRADLGSARGDTSHGASAGKPIGSEFSGEVMEVGAEVKAGQQACVVESVKAASDIYAPASGTVAAVNEALSSNPALINTDPYGEGWIFKIQLSSPDESGALKSPADYRSQLG